MFRRFRFERVPPHAQADGLQARELVEVYPTLRVWAEGLLAREPAGLDEGTHLPRRRI
jgi:hypothetical protein